MIDIKGFKNPDANPNSGKFLKKLGLFALAVIALLAVYYGGKLFVKYIQVEEVGKQYTSIFTTNLLTRLAVQGLSFLGIFIAVIISLFATRRNLAVLSIERRFLNSKGVSLAIGVVLSLVLGVLISGTLGEKFLLFANAQWFGEVDPVFGKEVGYYIFQRPFLVSLTESLFSIWVIISVFVFVAYWFFGTVYSGYTVRELISFRTIAIHLFVNIGILLAINCVSFVFKAENILYGTFGDLNGAGFTAKTVWLTFYRIAPFTIAALVIGAGIMVAKKKTGLALKTILFYPALWILTSVIAFGVQSFVVSPNEVIRENDSIAANIKYTQEAYGLDEISELDFNVQNDLTVEDINAHDEITDNIRVVDLSANLTALNQLQGIRNYYKFYETDIVPYTVDGKKTAVAVTAREITKENLSDTTDTYINRTLRYTHGFGITMNQINEVSAQGQPRFLIKDIPPKSAEGIQEIKQPRIYYGELTNDYVVVGNDAYKELDYSEGQEDIEFSYDGTGGLRLTFPNRAIFAAKYGDIRLLVSNLITSDSRILVNRNITQRLRTVAPFFKYDNDPYIVIDSKGNLKWIVDGYTTSDAYPYSQSYGEAGEFNYIRNSVKAVVDAYNGNVIFYMVDRNDPIARAYASMYPGLFSRDEFPEDLRQHVKYPEYMFKVQSDVYGKYHISNPTTFYNKNDQWVVAKERYGNSTEPQTLAAYYNMMKLEGEEEEELLLTVPYTLANKDNMVAWFAVRNEWDNYGRLQVYKFPKDINVYGPMQIENRINSDMDISKELNLWSQGGSQVIRGNMIVVPIDDSVLYVEPIYIASSDKSALPELKQVVVAYDEQIVMKGSLREALYALFGQTVPEDGEGINPEGMGEVTPEINAPTDYNSAAKEVVDSFGRAKQASSEGNWDAFGKAMAELEKSIDNLKKRVNE